MSDDGVTQSAGDPVKVEPEPSQPVVEEDQGAVIPVIVSEDKSKSEEKVVPELNVELQKVTTFNTSKVLRSSNQNVWGNLLTFEKHILLSTAPGRAWGLVKALGRAMARG